jgi:hypothetical protein
MFAVDESETERMVLDTPVEMKSDILESKSVTATAVKMGAEVHVKAK